MKVLAKRVKTISSIISLAVVATGIFASCQKVIHLDLNSANAQIVIEGYVTDQPGIDTIKITKSGSYFSPGTYPRVTNATVIISDNNGLSDTLVQVDSGVYATPNITGVPGRTYTMRALINGKEYDAVSTMPTAVNMDSATVYRTSTINIIHGVADTVDHVRCYFKDPPGIGNHYMIQGRINGLLLDSLDDFNLLSDQFTDGTEINRRLSNANPYPGQTVTVKLMCIDAGTYSYYRVVRGVASAGNPVSTAVPQNPPTNMVGGALGYFSAYTLRSVTQVAP